MNYSNLFKIALRAIGANKMRSFLTALGIIIGLYTLTEVSQVSHPHALKGQKLLAQGSALGIQAISKAPCKGKSFVDRKSVV